MVNIRRIVSSIVPERERDETTGLYAEKALLNAVLDVFGQVRGPIVTSSNVAEHLDCATETARRKLKELYDQEVVGKRTTGRTTVWWVTGGERIMPDERASTEDAENGDRGVRNAASTRTNQTPHTTTRRTRTQLHPQAQADSDTETTDNNSGVYGRHVR
jgi:predicted ArsR family transcriptional regulator